MKAIPKHLKKYIVKQNYHLYTDEDQAVWRYIMRQLKHFMKDNAYHCYEEGLKKTGLTTERIPKVVDIDKKLQRFGWGAVSVSGFIPPSAFMEFQALGYLPIASEMRSIDHIQYTPAPDIVHEAAGHAPILIDKNFSSYLKAYAKLASKAISSHEDIELYEAIRLLSDAKESPYTSKAKLMKLEKNLEEKALSFSFTSEAGYLARMNWWTAEYGLIGTQKKPKIYGAGLLSSLGESKSCLLPKVKKLDFNLDCLNYSYDITEPQPQLFVTPSFKKLETELKKLSNKMSYSTGGRHGLQMAIQAQTINTVELNSGLQISGQVEQYKIKDQGICFFKTLGPTQISYKNQELEGHAKSYHFHGYSSPVGYLKNQKKCLSDMNQKELKKIGIIKNKFCVLEYENGFIVSGFLADILRLKNKNLLFKFEDCTVVHDNTLYFHPNWGEFDLACGHKITSVFGGPADRLSYGEVQDFKANRIKKPKINQKKKDLMKSYKEIYKIRHSKLKNEASIIKIFDKIKRNHNDQWLIGLEVYELCLQKNLNSEFSEKVYDYLKKMKLKKTSEKFQLSQGIQIAKLKL